MTRTKASSTQPSSMYALASGSFPSEGDMAALDASGKLVAANHSSAVKVVGLCSGVRSGRALVLDELFVMDNDVTNPVTRKDRGAPCYVAGAVTVAAVRPAKGIVAGLVVDVDDEGVTVDFSPAAIAAAQALVPAEPAS